jgi:hypothetical protein
MSTKEKKEIEIIHRIPSHYVGKDCSQHMFHYRDEMLLLSPNEIMFQDLKGFNGIHTYLSDERRKQFPYSNIPVHNKRMFFKKLKITNHILEYDTPYLMMSDIEFVEKFVVKDGNEALLVTRGCTYEKEQTKELSREELEAMLTTIDSKENKRVILHKNHIGDKMIIPSNEEILISFKQELNRIFKAHVGKNREVTFERLIYNVDINDIPENFLFVKDAFVIDINGIDIKMKKISIYFINSNLYRVSIKPVTINKYSLEQIKSLAKQPSYANEPKISTKLNSTIDPEEVKFARQLVLDRKKD